MSQIAGKLRKVIIFKMSLATPADRAVIVRARKYRVIRE